MADPQDKKRLNFFDPTINAGHILTDGGVAAFFQNTDSFIK